MNTQRRACYTQGLDSDCRATGNYATMGLVLSLPEALAIVRALPVMPAFDAPSPGARPCDCPPAFGIVDWGNVCRFEDGTYVLWSSSYEESRECTLDEVIAWVEARFEAS